MSDRLKMVAAAIAALLIWPIAWFTLEHLKPEGMAWGGGWAAMIIVWLLAWFAVSQIANIKFRQKPIGLFFGLLIPVVFGLTLLFLWEVLTRGLGVPPILLPPPSQIATRIDNSIYIAFDLPVCLQSIEQSIQNFRQQPFLHHFRNLPPLDCKIFGGVLADDFRQTFKAVLFGYVVGCATGFAIAVLVDRSPFMRKGLMPIGNLVAALPIVGMAPIMVMWFGFDWQSKAAVVIVMTFFPMLVNTVAGLATAGHMERDLMRTYASSYWQTLFKLRLPAALPFIFNALKINSTLALIGAIVAEFFGTPIVGMGFRISTEVGRMNVDMVWAEIAMAALAGSLFYGLVALIERRLTFWHPSYR